MMYLFSFKVTVVQKLILIAFEFGVDLHLVYKIHFIINWELIGKKMYYIFSQYLYVLYIIFTNYLSWEIIMIH